MRSEGGFSAIPHCLEWYKLILRTRLSTYSSSAVSCTSLVLKPVRVRVCLSPVCLQTMESSRTASESGNSESPPTPRCQLMRVGGVVCQPRVRAFDVRNRVFTLPLCRQDLLFKIRHRSRLLDFGRRQHRVYAGKKSVPVLFSE